MRTPPCPTPPPRRPSRRPSGRAARVFTLGRAGALAALAACAGGGDVTPPPPPPPSLSLAAAPAAVSVQAGQSATATVRLTRGGPAAAVALGAAVAGAPAGVAAAFAPATVPADGAESAVTLTTTAATPAGDYTVTIRGSGGASASTTVTLRVDPAPVDPAPVDPAPVAPVAPVARYTLAVAPAPVAVTAGAAAAGATVAIARSHFAGAVALAAAGAPAGLTVTVPGAPVAGDAAALGVQAAAAVPAGDYPVTLTGSAAGLAPVTATLVVRVAAAPPPPPPTGVTPGFVTGTVVDAAGRPLAGVEVYADNTLYYNTNVIGYTDAQGRYKLDVRQPIGTWRVGAHLKREYNGRTYQLDLHPDAARAFPGVDGAVRNFDWRLIGKTPEGGSYGVATYVYRNWAPGEYVAVEDVEVTFTPVGPLVDGSTGQVGVVRLQGNYVSNIPLGRYKVTARWAPRDGRAARPMGVRVRDANSYTESTTLDWPANADGRPREAELEVYLPAREN